MGIDKCFRWSSLDVAWVGVWPGVFEGGGLVRFIM